MGGYPPLGRARMDVVVIIVDLVGDVDINGRFAFASVDVVSVDVADVPFGRGVVEGIACRR